MKLLLSSTATRQLSALLKQPGGAWLFVGPAQVGKYTAAKVVASKLAKHPSDVTTIVPDGLSIGIEQVHQLVHQLQLLAVSSKQPRVVIIDQAETLTHEAQNGLLKLLEESPLDTTIILISTVRNLLLPTILSRCQSVNFSLQPQAALSSWLQAHHNLDSPAADNLAKLSAGAVGLAIQLISDADQQAQLERLQAWAQKLYDGKVYEGVLLSKEIGNDRQLLQSLTEQLLALVRAQLRKVGSSRAQLVRVYKKMQAVLYIQRYLEANGSPKFAIDNLTLELAE